MSELARILRASGNRRFEPTGWLAMNSVTVNRRDFVRAVGMSIVTGRLDCRISLLNNARNAVLAAARVNFFANRQGSYRASNVELLVFNRGDTVEWLDLHFDSRVWGFRLAENFALDHSVLRAGDKIAWGDFTINVED